MPYNRFKTRQLKTNPTRALYSPDVLVGEWYQKRFHGKKQDEHAITPGIYGQSEFVVEKTTYKSDFIQPIAKTDPQGAEDFIDVKIVRFRNKMKNIETNIQQSNEMFLNNMTTMTDLQFRILPETLRGATKAHIFGEKVSKKGRYDDLTRCFGNQTNYGLVNAKRCEELKMSRQYRDVSEMRSNYGQYILEPLPANKVACK